MDSENSTLSINELLPGYNSNNSLTRNKVFSEELLFLQSLDLNLWKYGTPALYCVGCFGNLVTIMVLTRVRISFRAVLKFYRIEYHLVSLETAIK